MKPISRRAVSRRGALALPLLALVALGGCGDDPSTVESDPIIGMWVADVSGGSLFVVITDEELRYYTASDTEDCADRTIYELEALGGNEYLLQSTVTPVEVEARLVARGGELTWRTEFGAIVFYRSEADPSALPLCAGGGDDASLVCSELPTVEVGQAVSGALTQDDPSERGRFYDVYAYQPEAQGAVDITVSSTAVDAYLYVYNAAGDLLAENDDATADSRDAGLVFQVVPGCYRVEVTSFGPGETGPYTLRID